MASEANRSVSSLQSLIGLSEEFFVSCVSVARDSAFVGETCYHLPASFGTKMWHNLVAAIRERVTSEYGGQWECCEIKNLPVLVNHGTQKALFVSPMARSGVSTDDEIVLKRSFGLIAQSLCSNNEAELPFDDNRRITHSKVPRPYEVWSLVRQSDSRDGEILLELVKFAQNTGAIDRIPLPCVPAVAEDTDSVVRRDGTDTDVSSDVEIDIERREA